MKLKSLKYKENYTQNKENPWEFQEIIFGDLNLIIGKNATGKTRIIAVIHNLAKLIQAPQIIRNGNWNASFIDEFYNKLDYSIQIENSEIVHERILLNGNMKLSRSSSSVEIYSEISQNMQKISPPNDRLVLHVRRDKTEYPFFESLFSWANGVRGYRFANTSPDLIEIPGKPFQLGSLNAVPSALEQLTVLQLQIVLNQLQEIGYNLEKAETKPFEGLPPATKIVYLKEQGIDIPLKQFEISQGMFRAFALLTIIEYHRSTNDVGAILIDDLGEGLDFERSKKLAEIIFQKKADSKIQFITTSNDSFLMNAVSLNDFTVCHREKHTVHCFNYANSKEKFDNWKELGLNNFDLLSSNFLLDQ